MIDFIFVFENFYNQSFNNNELSPVKSPSDWAETEPSKLYGTTLERESKERGFELIAEKSSWDKGE